jgi:hypothetical protein
MAAWLKAERKARWITYGPLSKQETKIGSIHYRVAIEIKDRRR